MRPGTGDDVQHDDAASGEGTGRTDPTPQGADGDDATAPTGSPARTPSTARPAPAAGTSRPGSSKPRKPPRTAAERSAAAKKAAATRAANARARAEAAAVAAAAAEAAEEATAASGGTATDEAVPAVVQPAGAAQEESVHDDAGADAPTTTVPRTDEEPTDEGHDGGQAAVRPSVEEQQEPGEAQGPEGSEDAEDDVPPPQAEGTDGTGGGVAAATSAAGEDRLVAARTPAPRGGGALASRLAGVLRTAWGRTTAATGPARHPAAPSDATRSDAVPADAAHPGATLPDERDVAPTPIVGTPSEPDVRVEPPVPHDTDAASSAEAGSQVVADTEAPVVLRLSGLVKRYGSTTAVDGLDLEVRAGTFYGIVGPNGAGKTTTLSMVTGLLRPDEGTVTVLGADVWADPGAAKRSLGVLPDRLRLFDRLTGAQLLFYSATLRGLDGATARKRSADIATAFGLQDALGRLVSDYSVGMTKKIALAAAIIHSPRVLVLDEPFESVDPVSAATVTDVLRRYVSGGGTVLLSSHSMDLVERTCDNVAVVVDGHVLASGTVDDVREGRSLEQRFVELAGGRAVTEGMEWLQNFSD